MFQKAVKKEKKTLYVVWVIPVIAIFLALWMIYKYYDGLGKEIVIKMDDVSGFTLKKTPLIYRGIKVGFINDMEVDPNNLSKINVSILVRKKSYEHIARESSYFVKISPKITTTGVSGLSALLSGSYIEVFTKANSFKQMKKAKFQDHFIVQKKEKLKIDKSIKYVRLKAKSAFIKDGAPLVYKKEIIGKVIEHHFEGDAVIYTAQLENEYLNWVSENSRFYKLSAIDVKASLSGIDIQFDSLATLITGGITFDNSKKYKARKDSSKIYTLYKNRDDALLDSDVITLTSEKAYKLNAAHTHLYYKGFDAGKIISVDYSPIKDKTYFKIKFKPEFKKLFDEGLYFWIVKPQIELNKISGLDTIVGGNYITFTKDRSAQKSTQYTLHEYAPAKSGLHLYLRALSMKGLSEGSVVLYRDKEVGRIDKLQLTQKGVLLDITIYKKYKNLVNDSSIFYLNSAIDAKISLSGLKLNLPNLKSLTTGALTFDTINPNAVLHKKEFLLYEDKNRVHEERYLSDGLFVTLYSKTLDGYHKGSVIYHKKMTVGKIVDYAYDGNRFILKGFIEKKFAYLLNDSSYFYKSGGVDIRMNFPKMSLSMDSLASLISGGISFDTRIKDAGLPQDAKFKLFKSKEDAIDDAFVVQLKSDALHGLKEGSIITLKGVKIGEVKSITLNDDATLNIKASIDKKYRSYFNSTTYLHISAFQAGVEGVKNPSTLLTGSKIELFVKERNAAFQNKFILHAQKLPKSFYKDGLRLHIEADKLAGLHIDSPIYYRQVEIGNVESFHLSDDASYVDVGIFIKKKYAYLVRKNSLFYSASGIGVDMSLFGIKVKTETLATIIKGGLVLITPDKFTQQADKNSSYTLHYKIDEDWLEYKPKIKSH